MSADFQPRWIACAVARRLDPATMFEHDGSNVEYILWIGARWREWRTENGIDPKAPLYQAQHEHFDAWLERRAIELRDAEVPA